jgi:hypothetical protein
MAALLVVPLLMAQQASPPRLIVFSDQLADPLVARVLAELRSQGFEVVTISAVATRTPDQQMRQLAEAADAVAAVRIETLESAVEVRVVDRTTERTFIRRLDVEGDRAVAAMRTVELLRTRLVNLLAFAPRPQPRVVEAAQPPALAGHPRPAYTSPRQERFGLAFEFGAAQSPGGSTASLPVLAAFRWRHARHWMVESLGLVSLVPSEYRQRDGIARLSFGSLGVGVGWHPLTGRRWAPDLGAGTGATWIHIRGVPSAGFYGHGDMSWSISPYLRTGFSFRLWRSLSIRADLLAELLLPRTLVLFEDRTVGAWGRPLVAGAAGLEWNLP